MSLLLIFVSIAVLVLLITYFKINAFLAFLIVSILAGLLLGIPAPQIIGSVQKGMGDMLGSLIIVVVAGAMLGKLAAESGAAQRIAAGMMKLFGASQIHWALLITGFIIGIPLFYNVGFVLVIPLIFSVAQRYNLPVVYIGVPMMAALSVTHGFLPPHPSPTALVAQFHADMGTTLFYGILIGFPTSILAGPVFAKAVRNIKAPMLSTFKSVDLPESQLPGLGVSIFSSLLPVLLLAITTLVTMATIENDVLKTVIAFFSDPAIVMLISLAVATYMLGLRMGMKMKRIMDIYVEAVKDITILLLIMGGAGSLKQILMDSGVSAEIATLLNGLDVHPLILGWTIACVIRVCVGSATVAGLTAAGIVLPLLDQPGVNPNLMVLAVGAGSLMFSHVNDSGFWLFKEYFNLSIKDTIRSWSLMETIVAIAGIIGVMILDAFV
ncbi:gluconate:H+ symporter [Chryseolinea sp. H1M3-3]|uniref:gluconate:H+ symporter n=1 Tax=Chryseolinea sp. H1M3-3 TaxID=3034144 RepID=UPI0023EE23E8|nr:gluconate:H+ symporter [Chryseolinea sp. H1M3-3]